MRRFQASIEAADFGSIFYRPPGVDPLEHDRRRAPPAELEQQAQRDRDLADGHLVELAGGGYWRRRCRSAP